MAQAPSTKAFGNWLVERLSRERSHRGDTQCLIGGILMARIAQGSSL